LFGLLISIPKPATRLFAVLNSGGGAIHSERLLSGHNVRFRTSQPQSIHLNIVFTMGPHSR